MVKNQFVIKLSLTTLLITQLFGCATRAPQSAPRTPVAAAPAPAALPAEPVAQEVGLDKNEVIVDKPSPVKPDAAALLARISAMQQSRIALALRDGNNDAKAQATINQATPKLRAFIERLSCIRQYNDGGSATLQALAAPSASFQFFVPPMHGTKAHNKSTCLTVSNVQLKPVTFQGVAAIQIKVSYVAEDSGETTTSNHEINKNSKGVWWFTR